MDAKLIKGNQPLLLNDLKVVWLLQSGSLALFATRIRNGEAEGDRRHLFNVFPGEALFGIAPDSDDDCLSVIAVALEPAEVVPLEFSCNEITPEKADFFDFTPDSQPLIPNPHALVENWIHKIGQVSGLPQPKLGDLLPPAQYLSLLKGQIFQSRDQVVWVRIQQGTAHWMGYPEFPLTPETPCFPLGTGMWLVADDNLELYARGTSEVEGNHVIHNGLAHLYTFFLRWIEWVEAQEMQAALRQFQARQQLNRQVTQQTIQNLAAVLKPQPDGFLQADTPLLIAAGAVGKALGVTIEPPMRSEDLKRVKEPLEAIARSSRLRLRRVLLRDKWWKKDAGPLIAYTCIHKHPVALLPVAGNRYELFDPVEAGLVNEPDTPVESTPKLASGRIAIDDQVASTLEPVAFMFYRPLPDGVMRSIDLLKFALSGRQRDLIAILLTGVAATLLGMLVPQATAVLIDQAIPYGNAGLLAQLGIGLLAVAFGGTCFQLGQAIASMRIETISDASLQAAVWDRLLKLRTTFFRHYSVGDLNSRVSGISAIRRKLSGTVLQTIFSGFFALLNLGLLFYYSVSLAVLALVVAIVVMTFTIVSGTLLIRKNRPLIEIEGEIIGVIIQLINGVPKLRIAGVEERAFAYWGQKYTKQLRLTLSTQRLEDAVVLFNTILPTLTTVALFWLASTLITPNPANATQLTTGSFLAFSVAYGTFIGGVTSLSSTVIEVLDIIPLWQRSKPILAAEPEVDLNKADPGRLLGEIEVDHVSFRYREDGPLILDDVTLNIQPGEFIAIVGTSGSGKSTLFRLLLGFDTPISGTVYYDGQDLAGLDVAAVRRQLGVVLQNSRINAGSIFENIASGALISMDEAWMAAEMSGLADDVRAMPMELHTVISEGGTNLSGGQRQRLIIARALALKPRILLLDEATSALDNQTQAIVSKSLDRLKVARIVIAHRLSTIRNADRIYVLDAGRIAQQGTFDELATQPGLFAQLIRRQVT
ncbi:MAG: NHLP bacteriocin export ABC transporter permease/ATPase subunit [Cyanobacteria bacterium CRU_2_1]|nr:NHLP bacteriocin export ABC transporter permease/ATPase subunit [Cyanobacteria bacterium RU_5_0]NJR59583.1 NHLP bacteriocin export ABC transporter permease/ATPase subunit [Cyanobacteria bacterium CRU_2_1]